MPAKAFLKSALLKGKAVLRIDPKYRKGDNGRLLVILEVRRYYVNLTLIRHGQSYFDTRYSWPERFRTYAMAEAHTFENYLGIWKYKKTRRRYLLRLRKEGKTVYSARNTYFVTRIQKADEIDLFKFEGLFLRVLGKLKNNSNTGKRGIAFLSVTSATEERTGCI